MRYKIIYHVGPEISLKTKVDDGFLTIEDNSIQITSASPVILALKTIKIVELFRLHGLGRMIKVVCTDQTLFLSVVRFSFFGMFALINFFKTGRLFEELKKYE